MLFVVHYSLSTFLIYNAVTTLDMTSPLKYAAAELNTVKYLKLAELELIFSTLCQVCGFVTVELWWRKYCKKNIHLIKLCKCKDSD